MFFERYEKLCKNKNKTTTGVAAELGIAKSTVAYWRANNNVIPKQDVLLKMAEYFNVSVDYLLGNINIENPLKSSISDDDIKFALWGDVADEIPNDKLQEVKTFAEFIKNTYKKDNNK